MTSGLLLPQTIFWWNGKMRLLVSLMSLKTLCEFQWCLCFWPIPHLLQIRKQLIWKTLASVKQLCQSLTYMISIKLISVGEALLPPLIRFRKWLVVYMKEGGYRSFNSRWNVCGMQFSTPRFSFGIRCLWQLVWGRFFSEIWDRTIYDNVVGSLLYISMICFQGKFCAWKTIMAT